MRPHSVLFALTALLLASGVGYGDRIYCRKAGEEWSAEQVCDWMVVVCEYEETGGMWEGFEYSHDGGDTWVSMGTGTEEEYQEGWKRYWVDWITPPLSGSPKNINVQWRGVRAFLEMGPPPQWQEVYIGPEDWDVFNTVVTAGTGDEILLSNGTDVVTVTWNFSHYNPS